MLRKLGVLQNIERYAVIPNNIAIHRYTDGRILSEQNLLPHCGSVYGSPYLLIHRADFHYVLASAAKQLGVKIQLNSAVKGVDFNKPGLELDDGTVVQGDVVIAADGLRSQCREALLGGKAPPIPKRTLVYRVTLDPAYLMKHEDLESLVDYPEIHYWIGARSFFALNGTPSNFAILGPHSHVVFYPLREREPCNLIIVAPDTTTEFENSSKANLSEIKELTKNWEPRIKKMMGMVASSTKWRLQENMEMENWTSKQGTFTMLGDACHAIIPYLYVGLIYKIKYD